MLCRVCKHVFVTTNVLNWYIFRVEEIMSWAWKLPKRKDSQKAQTPWQVMTKIGLILSWNTNYKNKKQKHKMCKM